MRKHPSTLTNNSISPARYKELKAICEQYNDYVAGYLGEYGNRRSKIIMKTAIMAAGREWPAMLASVMTEQPIKDVVPAMGSDARRFYNMRMDFFVMLHKAIGYDK